MPLPVAAVRRSAPHVDGRCSASLPPAVKASTLALILAAALGAAGAAHAARPLITDDARVVDPGACQLESWLRRTRVATEYWALPACNPTGNLELTLGGARLHDGGGTRSLNLTLQAKTVWRALRPDGWGAALAAGTSVDPVSGARDLYAYLPLSWSINNDARFVHLNLGARRDDAKGQKVFTWGVGLEQPLDATFVVIAETFGQDKGNPLAQIGLRASLVPDRLQVDATMGGRFGGGRDQRWLSIGLRLLSPPLR